MARKSTKENKNIYQRTREWNNSIKHEYADQAGLCGDCVLLVNPYGADLDTVEVASGGLLHHFR